MAQGDVTMFQEWQDALEAWIATDDIKLALLDNTSTPVAATTTPTLADFTEVGAAGTYVTGGTSLGNWGAVITQSGAVVTIDSATNPSWAKDASNDTDAFWGLLYNDTAATNPALLFVDLGGPVDMTAGDLTITWNASGIVTLTIT